MRSDESLPGEFRDAADWTADPETGASQPAIDRLTFYYGPEYHRHPYSGYERNKLFLEIAYDKALAAIRRGKQVMVFVHARNDTNRTARALVERAPRGR